MKAIVLAAGKGTRLLREGDDFPKAMKPLCGKPLLGYVLDALNFIPRKDICVVVGYKREKITEAFDGYTFVVQEQQLGTGHAAKVCQDALEGYDGPVLVTLGDMPMVKSQTFRDMFETYKRDNCACIILTAVTEQKLPYGRICRDDNGEFSAIVEQKDCTGEQLAIKELNPSIYVFDSKKLFAALSMLRNNNAQSEYYLTDVPKILKNAGEKVKTCTICDDVQIMGINTLEDLAECEKHLK